MTRLYVLRELFSGPRETPFEPSPSFRDEWWTRPGAPQGVNVRYFELREGVEDVTRLRVFDPSSILVPLVDFDPMLATIEVDRIETRVERRCEGLAIRALDLLRETFVNSQVVAFSHNDEFWEKTDFKAKRRADGRSLDATVFVASPLH